MSIEGDRLYQIEKRAQSPATNWKCLAQQDVPWLIAELRKCQTDLVRIQAAHRPNRERQREAG